MEKTIHTFGRTVKRLLCFILMLCMIAPIIATTPAQASGSEETMSTSALTPQYGPNGKFLAPIEILSPETIVNEGYIAITNRADLELIGNNPAYPLDGKYYLTGSINLSGAEWTPIGAESNPFTGVFDGQGYLVNSLSVEDSQNTKSYYGLFGYSNSAIVKNVGLVDISISISTTMDTQFARVGGICGAVFGLSIISNCYTSGSISIPFGQYGNVGAGGICGEANVFTSIEHCYNTGDIFAGLPILYAQYGNIIPPNVGGICGTGSNISISNCYNSGSISSTHITTAIAGGVIGGGSNLTINACFNSGDVLTSGVIGASGLYSGGICGRVYSGGVSNISCCYNVGNITAGITDSDAFAGGVLGFSDTFFNGLNNASITVTNCYNIGDISTSANSSSYMESSAVAGGVCGYIGINSFDIINCYNSGDISATNYSTTPITNIGAIIGSVADSIAFSLSNCYWNISNTQRMSGYTFPNEEKIGVGDDTDTTVPLSPEGMQKQSSFAGFDFKSIWGFRRDEHDYPVLRAFGDVDDTAISIEKTEYTKGQVEVLSKPLAIPVSIFNNNHGLASFQMTISYDDTVFTAISVESGSVWDGGITSNLSESGKIVLAGSSASLKTGDGDIAIIEFEVNNKSADGVYPITLEIEELKTLDELNNQIEIPCITLDGTITLGSVMRGDVYEDGFIRASDATEVLLHLAELKELTERQLIAAKMTTPLSSKVSVLDANEILLIAVGRKPPPPAFSELTQSSSTISISGIAATLGDAVELSVGSAIGNLGDTVTIPITISDNSGFSAFDFKIEYDKTRLTPISVESGDIWLEEITVNLEAGDGEYICVAGISSENCDTDGTIVEITFEVNEGANFGTAIIELIVEALGYVDSVPNTHELPFVVNNGKIVIGTITPGDVNEDGRVDATDLSMLIFDFGKSGTDITHPNSDVNGDKKVDATDLSILIANFGK